MYKNRIDVERLKQVTNTPEILFSVLYHIAGISENDFHRTGRYYQFKQASGLQVYQSDKQDKQWVMFNYSDKASDLTGIPMSFGGDALNLCRWSSQDGFISACKLLCEIARIDFNNFYDGNSSNILIGNLKPIERKEYKEPDFAPNNGQEKQIRFTYSTADTSEVYNDIVQSYWDEWNITPDTLNTYGIKPLARTKNKKTGVDYRYSAQRPALLFKAGDNVKMKTIGGKKFTMALVNSGNYVFGYDQLPETADVLIFAEGEKDTLVINQHFNQYGIYAITGGGAGFNINKKWLNELHQRFNRIIMMLDNDGSGRKGMQKNKEAHPSLDVYDLGYMVNDPEKYPDCSFDKDGDNKTLNDIADVYKYNPSLLKDIITDAVLTTSISSDPLNRFSIPVDKCYTFTIQNYLGEEILNTLTGKYPSEIISQIISDHTRVYLNSYTGTGKSWLFKSFIDKSWLHLPSDVKRIIIAAPTKAIVKQLHNDYTSEGVDVEMVTGDGSTQDYNYIAESGTKIIITTWDSLLKVSFLLSESLLVVDEVSEMTSKESGYRSKAINNVFDLIQYAKRTLFLSATPNLINCSNIDAVCDKHLYDFTLIKVQQENPQAYKVQPYLLQSRKDIANIIQHHQTMFPNGLHLIKYDNVNMLQAYQSKTGGTIFSSKDKKYSDENPAYQSVMNDGIIPDGTNHVYTTSLVSSGTSIKNQIDSISIIDETSAKNQMQMLSRGRMISAENQAASINEIINGYLFNIGESTDIEDYNREVTHTGTDIRSLYLEQIKDAYALADIVNNKRDLDITKNVIKILDYESSKTICYVRHSKVDATYKVNHVAIFNQIEKYKGLQIGYAGMLKELRELHPSVEILTPRFLDAPVDTDVSDQYQHNKELTEQKQKELKELLVTDTDGFLISAYGLEKNTRNLKKIRKLIDVSGGADKYSNELDIHYHKILNTLLYLNIKTPDIKTKQNWLSLSEAAALVRSCSRQEVLSIQDRINTQFNLAAYKILSRESNDQKATNECIAADLPVLAKSTQYKMEELTAIKSVIQKHKKKSTLVDGCIVANKKELNNILNKDAKFDAISILKTLYHVRYDNKTHSWYIGKPHSITSSIKYGRDMISKYSEKSTEKSEPIFPTQKSQNH